MRVTNSIVQRNAVNALQQNLQRMTQAQTQVNTGQRYERFSDDPQAQSNIMQSSSALRALDQYQRNINDASSRASQEDTVLQQLTDAMDRAKDIAVQQGSSTASASTRTAAKTEVDSIIDFVVSLGNTKYAGGYLFGGDKTDTAPVSNTPPFYTSAPPTGEHTTEISEGQLFKSNHNAGEILLNTNVLQSLKSLSTALGSGDVTQVSGSIAALGNANDAVQSLVGDIGARVNQLDVTGSNLDALKTNLTTFKSGLSEVDQETAITDLVSRQTAYQSAMLATSRVIGMTLTDYLR